MRQIVEICGVNTATLKTLTEEEKQALLRKVRNEGSREAREALVSGNLRLVLSVIGRLCRPDSWMRKAD